MIRNNYIDILPPPPPLIRVHLSDLEGAPGEQLQAKGSNHDPGPQLIACPVLGAWGFGHCNVIMNTIMTF